MSLPHAPPMPKPRLQPFSAKSFLKHSSTPRASTSAHSAGRTPASGGAKPNASARPKPKVPILTESSVKRENTEHNEKAGRPDDSSAQPEKATPSNDTSIDTDTRPCSSKICNGRVPITVQFKLCDKCRKRSRDNARRRTLLMKEMREKSRAEALRLSSSLGPSEDDPVPPQALDAALSLTEEERFKNFMSQLRASGKLKTSTLGKRRAIDEWTLPADGSPHKLHPDIPEYRIAEDMYNALFDEVTRPGRGPGNPRATTVFRGFYCVVRGTEDPITKERVEAVVEMANAMAGLPYKKDSPPKQRNFVTTDGELVGLELRYKCRCQFGSNATRCGGIVRAKVEKVQEGVTPGERVTLCVEHDL